MDDNSEKHKVEKFYSQEAKKYIEMYGGNYEYYPANQIRLEIIVSRLKANNCKKILDVGCGGGIFWHG